MEVECTANGTCTVNIANFPVQVSLPCTFGDCQSPDNPALFSSELPPRNASAKHGLVQAVKEWQPRTFE